MMRLRHQPPNYMPCTDELTSERAAKVMCLRVPSAQGFACEVQSAESRRLCHVLVYVGELAGSKEPKGTCCWAIQQSLAICETCMVRHTHEVWLVGPAPGKVVLPLTFQEFVAFCRVETVDGCEVTQDNILQFLL